jgi:DNA-binding protein HU-beta
VKALPEETEPTVLTESTESTTTNPDDMNKKSIIKTAAFKSLMPYKAELKAVDAFLCTISDALKEGKEVNIPDFGRFYVQDCPERQGRNPQTGEVITIPATKRIRFKPYGNITNLSMKYGIF